MPVEIGESAEPIPIHFAYKRDINLETEQFGHEWPSGQPLRDLFDTPDLAAMDDYDRAIEWARKNSFLHHEALANELCAKFHLARGRTQVARVHASSRTTGCNGRGSPTDDK